MRRLVRSATFEGAESYRIVEHGDKAAMEAKEMSVELGSETDRSPMMERALALLMMVDGKDRVDAPVIAELAAQLQGQVARGDVGGEWERALVGTAVAQAGAAFVGV